MSHIRQVRRQSKLQICKELLSIKAKSVKNFPLTCVLIYSELFSCRRILSLGGTGRLKQQLMSTQCHTLAKLDSSCSCYFPHLDRQWINQYPSCIMPHLQTPSPTAESLTYLRITPRVCSICSFTPLSIFNRLKSLPLINNVTVVPVLLPTSSPERCRLVQANRSCALWL